MIKLEQVRGEMLERFERIDRRFAQNEQRLGRMEQRLAELTDRIEALRGELLAQLGLREWGDVTVGSRRSSVVCRSPQSESTVDSPSPQSESAVDGCTAPD